jgi:hypothetical protein
LSKETNKTIKKNEVQILIRKKFKPGEPEAPLGVHGARSGGASTIEAGIAPPQRAYILKPL